MRRTAITRALLLGAMGLALLAAEPTRAHAANRGIVFFGADVGPAYMNLRAFEWGGLLPEIVQTSGTGIQLGGTAGVRLLFLSIGADVELASYPDFSIGNFMVQADAHLPMPLPVEPYVRLGFGYAWVGQNLDELNGASIRGYCFRAGFGIDFYLGKHFSLGATAQIDLLNLSRQAIGDSPTSFALTDGSAFGFQVSGLVNAQLHF